MVATLGLIAIFGRGLGARRALLATAGLLVVFLAPWLVHVALSPPMRPTVTPAYVPVSPAARVVGRELADQPYAPGDTVQVTVIWQATAYTATDRQSGLRLVPYDGDLPLAEHWARPNLDRTPTGKWVQGELIPDTLALRIPLETVPGRYSLLAGLRDGQQTDLAPIAEIEVR
jgi:hypothetical protein